MGTGAAGVPGHEYWTGYVGTSVYAHVMYIICEHILGYQVSIQF